MDKKTELEKEVRVKWLENASDLVRDPCQYPKKSREVLLSIKTGLVLLTCV